MLVNIILLIITFIIEFYNKKQNNPTPIFSIPNELFLIYIFIYINILNISNIYIYFINIVFFLHLWRVLLYYNIYINIPLELNILGIIGTLSLFNNYTFILEPLIRLYINYIINKNIGLNFIIDSIAITILFSNYNNIMNIINNNVIINYYKADIIYHILEIIAYYFIKY